MDLKKRHKVVLGILDEGQATFEELVEKSGYTEKTIEKTIDELFQYNEIDILNDHENTITIYFLPVEESKPIAEKKELSNPEDWNIGAKPIIEENKQIEGLAYSAPSVEEAFDESIEEFGEVYENLAKDTKPEIQELKYHHPMHIKKGDEFIFRLDQYQVDYVITQQEINGQPYVKFVATSGKNVIQFRINAARKKSPISIKRLK